MASRVCNRALRASLARQLASPIVQRRTLVSVFGGLRTGIAASTKPAVGAFLQQSRGLKTIDFAGHKEQVFGLFEHLAVRGHQGLTVTKSVRIGQGKSFWYVPSSNTELRLNLSNTTRVNISKCVI